MIYSYNVKEIFYSLKGEGMYTGTPMTFIRLSGCNLKCEFCDTDHSLYARMTEDEILSVVRKNPTKRIVLTGGEPLIQSVKPLLESLAAEDYLIHLETNGMFEVPNFVDWVAVSPKNLNCDMATILLADEIKFLVGGPDWENFIERFLNAYSESIERSDAKLYVMPIAKSLEIGNRTVQDIIPENVEQAIQFCKANPQFSLCMQMHKVVGIP